MTDSLRTLAETALQLSERATEGPWEFRATEHSGGIQFVVAPNAPRNDNGTEFIPADCSHGYNGRLIAFSRTALPKLARAYLYVLQMKDEQSVTACRISKIMLENDKRVKDFEQQLTEVSARLAVAREALTLVEAHITISGAAEGVGKHTWSKTLADVREALTKIERGDGK